MSAAAASNWRRLSIIGRSTLPASLSRCRNFDRRLYRLSSATRRPRVIAVDTGHGQIDFRLRQDERVRLLEKTNARYLTREQIGEAVDLIVMDVSFISATLVLPAVIAAALPESNDARKGKQIVVLVKPQFEAGREQVGKGRDRARSRCARRRGRESPPEFDRSRLHAHRTYRIPHPRRGREPRISALRGILGHLLFIAINRDATTITF